ncbi:MAG: CoA-binding protein [Pseudomonadota bacterium]|nr:CoA-binding protein [Pseudomonadota bacterium]
MSNLNSFFAPRNVAVIGASSTPGKPGRAVIENLIANKFKGKIFPVNPGGGNICGLNVIKSTDALPTNIDMGIVLLPAQNAPQIILECAAKNIKTIVLAAGGFAEVDQLGKDLQAELKSVISRTGVRVLGPNTAGHISTPQNFTSSFFPLGKIPSGPISYIAQTGNFTGALMRSIMTGEHYGVSRCVGLGNTIDIDEVDVLEFLHKDPLTGAIFIYLESLHRPKEFLKLARKVTREKPVIMLKGGATEGGAEAALSHTASMGSDDSILDGALKQTGVVRVEDFSDLFTAAKAAAMMPIPAGNRIGFVSPSGAFIVHILDLCLQRTQLVFSKISAQTQSRLEEISPPFIKVANPVDIFPAATVNGMEFAWRESMIALLRDPSVDAVVTILILADELGPMKLDFIVELSKQFSKKPIYVSFSGDENNNAEAKAFLEPKGVPTFPRIGDPFKVLDILVRSRLALAS